MRHHSAEVLFRTHQPALRRHRVPLRLVRFQHVASRRERPGRNSDRYRPGSADPPPGPHADAHHRQWAHHTGSGAPLQTGRNVHFDSGITDLGDTRTEVFSIRWTVDGHDVNPPAYGSHAGIPAHTTVLNGNSQFDWTPPAQAHTPSR